MDANASLNLLVPAHPSACLSQLASNKDDIHAHPLRPFAVLVILLLVILVLVIFTLVTKTLEGVVVGQPNLTWPPKSQNERIQLKKNFWGTPLGPLWAIL